MPGRFLCVLVVHVRNMNVGDIEINDSGAPLWIVMFSPNDIVETPYMYLVYATRKPPKMAQVDWFTISWFTILGNIP